MYFQGTDQGQFIHREYNYVFFLRQNLFNGTTACYTYNKALQNKQHVFTFIIQR